MIFLSLCFAVSAIAIVSSNTLNTNVILKSESARETGGHYWEIGTSGERSAYQFKETTWILYSSVDFRHASEKAYQNEVDRVARLYLRSIIVSLIQEDQTVTAYNVALKWTDGIHSHNHTKAKKLYAEDVEHLYQSYLVSD